MPTEKTADLRRQMIIRKANCSRTVTAKSLLSFILVWGLWFLTAYLVADDRQHLFNHPLIGSWTLADIGKTAFAAVLGQIALIQLWSICMTVLNRRLRHENTAAQKTEKTAEYAE
ncbi:hypothetical protein [Neisseria sp.]|uniref:hypothetical protein n=1 Tax=Neisseria sp. TaxID=192066 RepID=UPI0035A12658